MISGSEFLRVVRRLHRAEVTPQQVAFLVAIRDGADCPGAVAAALGIKNAGVCSLFRGAHKHGYVERTIMEADMRKALLTLTPEGAAFLDRVFRPVA